MPIRDRDKNPRNDYGIRAMLGFVRTVLWPHQRHRSNDDDVEHACLAPAILVVEAPSKLARPLAPVLRRAFPDGSLLSVPTVEESLRVLATQAFDIAVVDLDLPDGSGIPVVRESQQGRRSTRCVIATTHEDDDHLMSALAAGALGYLLKNQSESVLIQQLQLLAKGIPPLAPTIARRLAQHFAVDRPPAHAAAAPSASPAPDDLVRLSEREKEVLSFIAKGLQIPEVAALLEISTNTVCSHIKNIYRKRHLSSRAEAALEAQRLGLV